jgi:hypothetical protein
MTRVQRRMDRLILYNDDRHDFDEACVFRMAPPVQKLRRNKLRWNLPEGFTPLNPAAYYNLWKGSDPAWEEKLLEILRRRDEEAVVAEGAKVPVELLESDGNDAKASGLSQGLRVQ